MPEHKALMIAELFLKKRNPDYWNGVGERPESLDSRLFFFELRKGGICNFSLSIEWTPVEGEENIYAWVCVCRCWRPADGRAERVRYSHCINSKEAIAELIMSIL